jgi:hypothetical protein
VELEGFMTISQEELLEILTEIQTIGCETDTLLLADFISVIQTKLNKFLESN